MMIRTMVVTTISVVVMTMMIAAGIRIIIERPFCQRPGSSICLSPDTGVEPDSGIRERHLRAHSDTATYQGINLGSLKESGQSSVTAAVCFYHLLFRDFTIFNIVEFELFRMTEMLKYFSIFVGNCDSHSIAPFFKYFLARYNRFAFAATAEKSTAVGKTGICSVKLQRLPVFRHQIVHAALCQQAAHCITGYGRVRHRVHMADDNLRVRYGPGNSFHIFVIHD